ncbi:NADH-quinone oxidoreductase subunit A [soil metagenome]
MKLACSKVIFRIVLLEGRSYLTALALLQGTQEISYGTLYVYVGLSILLFTGFAAAVLILARLIAPSSRSSREQGNIYETGEASVTDPWRPFPVRYYVFALLFLIFDVEAAFLFPWAVIYRSLGLYGFIEMAIFVLILGVGLAYAWKKGALEWV